MRRTPSNAIPLIAVAVALAGALLVPGCTTAPGTNTTGTPTNAAEQVAGGLYSAYIAADTAWLGVLTAGKATPALIAKIEPVRKQARAALDTFAAASVKGVAAAEQAAAQSAIAALTAALVANGIKVGG